MSAGFDAIADLLRRAVAAHQAGRLEEAEQGYRQVLGQRPGNPDALNLLGVIAAARGAPREAVALFDRALRSNPEFAVAHFNRGNALADLSDVDRARFSYKKSIKINPLLADAWLNLGALLHRTGDRDDAIATFETMVARCPDDPRGYFNLGRCLIEAKRARDAVAPLQRAVAIAPDNADYHQALAEAFADVGATDDAVTHFKRAHLAAPNNTKILTNLGTTLAEAGDETAALDVFEKALAIDPGNRSTRTNRGLTLLSLGKLAAGWTDYAGRHDDPEFIAKRPRRALPLWQGEDLSEKSILVTGDQGLGDEILYGSMLGDLAARGAAVTLECHRRLVGLFQRSFPTLKVRANGTVDTAAFDYTSSLIDLGQWLRPTLASFKNGRAFLAPDPGRLAHERSRWADERRMKVGISWRSSNPTIGGDKTLSLSAWTPVLQSPDAVFVDLQYGADADLQPALYRDGLDLTNDIEGVAARISALDLVLTVSNTVAHLAGALGVPTWVLVPHRRGRLWYWFKAGPHSPWYRTVRIFRYDARTDVTALMQDLASVLRHHA